MLNTQRAIEVSVFIVRAYIKMRKFVARNKELQKKISQIESRLADHDEQITDLIKVVKTFLNPEPLPKKRRIGF